MERFETPVRTKIAVALAGVAMLVAAAITRDVGPFVQSAEQAEQPAVQTEQPIEAPDAPADEPTPLRIDDLEPGLSVQIKPLDLSGD